ncbi:hypothetical protein BDP27DRAFT_1432628 [Rhodocollybia butyracea]|uniref:Uncharacterized protein n=1 Tax=Rhodocollybia butyracea TaxID=206335 RepID=A0A9P5P866_9AGAR|nr:hypothetical protein BDP27DRAFT_1432628 [Rhodocollybia butyracea]
MAAHKTLELIITTRNRFGSDSFELLVSGFHAPLTPSRPASAKSNRSRNGGHLKTLEHMALKVQRLEYRVQALQRQVRTYKDIFDRLGYICSSIGDESFEAEEFCTHLIYI